MSGSFSQITAQLERELLVAIAICPAPRGAAPDDLDLLIGACLMIAIANRGCIVMSQIQTLVLLSRCGRLTGAAPLSEFRQMLGREIVQQTCADDRIELEPIDYDKLMGAMVVELSRCGFIREENFRSLFNQVIAERRQLLAVGGP